MAQHRSSIVGGWVAIDDDGDVLALADGDHIKAEHEARLPPTQDRANFIESEYYTRFSRITRNIAWVEYFYFVLACADPARDGGRALPHDRERAHHWDGKQTQRGPAYHSKTSNKTIRFIGNLGIPAVFVRRASLYLPTQAHHARARSGARGGVGRGSALYARLHPGSSPPVRDRAPVHSWVMLRCIAHPTGPRTPSHRSHPV